MGSIGRTEKQTADFSWYVIGRWQEYQGEQRANLLRLISIAAFYCVELINRHGIDIGFLQMPRQEHVTDRFHLAITAVAVAWTMLGIGIHVCLRNQFFPIWLKYISTACDLALLTSILVIADGPRSPLVVGYFLLVALSVLRFNLPLIRFATIGAMLAYVYLNGFARWFTEREIRVPRYHQLIMLLALGLTGIILGQVIRKVHGIASEYAQRQEAGVQKDA